MKEEGKITMSEFKTVVERFEDNQKKMIEVMNHRFDQQDIRIGRMEQRMGGVEQRMGGVEQRMGGVEQQMGGVEQQMGGMEGRMGRIEKQHVTMMEQIALLHEGQTEIKSELRSRVTNADFEKLEMRVVRLENRVA
ncbi:hypothetical protein K8S19_12710 [bacterium]|nr:hypothetical protein [bacterium]